MPAVRSSAVCCGFSYIQCWNLSTVATQGSVSMMDSRCCIFARFRSSSFSKNSSQKSIVISSMDMEASSATSDGVCLNAFSVRSRVTSECTAWPPSCSKRHHIAQVGSRIHENKRHSNLVQRIIVATRRFSLSVIPGPGASSFSWCAGNRPGRGPGGEKQRIVLSSSSSPVANGFSGASPLRVYFCIPRTERVHLQRFFSFRGHFDPAGERQLFLPIHEN